MTRSLGNTLATAGWHVTAAEVEGLFRRLSRIRQRTRNHAGERCAWQYTFPEGDTTTYKIIGVKPPEIVEDEIRELLT